MTKYKNALFNIFKEYFEKYLPDNVKYLTKAISNNHYITHLHLDGNNIDDDSDNFEYLAEIEKLE